MCWRWASLLDGRKRLCGNNIAKRKKCEGEMVNLALGCVRHYMCLLRFLAVVYLIQRCSVPFIHHNIYILQGVHHLFESQGSPRKEKRIWSWRGERRIWAGVAGGAEGIEEAGGEGDFTGEEAARGLLATAVEIGHGKVLLELVHNIKI